MDLVHFRELNTLLAVATVCGLLYRTPEALQNVAAKRLYVVLALFPVVVGLASVWALAEQLEARNPFIAAFTALYAALALIETVFWPKALTGQTRRGSHGSPDLPG